MLRLAIIADDLTGTLDSAAPFADAGLRVVVATSPAAVAAALPGAEVLAVSTNSREIAPDAAAAAVAAVLAQLPAGVRLFKKVDSRLKGNVASELAAMPAGPVLAVPAIPDFGRLVRDGAICGFGVVQPIRVEDVLAAGARELRVPDTTTLAEMAQAVRQAPEGMLILGARGAAVALAGVLAGERERPADLTVLLPMLIVVGSTDPITLEQVAELRRARPDLRWSGAPDGVVVGGLASEVPLILMQSTPGTGATGPAVATALASGIAALAGDAATLVLTGGATAEAVLARLGIAVLAVQGDILPGLPLSLAAGRRIITKSGGFSGAGTLVALVEKAVRA